MLPATVIVGKSAYDWKTKPIRRARGGRPSTRRPSISNSPASGVANPAMRRRSVVLPHPLPPTSVTNSPGSRVSETSATATVRPYVLRSPRNANPSMGSRYFDS